MHTGLRDLTGGDLRNLQQQGAKIAMMRKKCGPEHAGG